MLLELVLVVSGLFFLLFHHSFKHTSAEIVKSNDDKRPDMVRVLGNLLSAQ